MKKISEIKDAVMPSLTEWLERIGHSNAEAFRIEDNAKRDRLEVLYETIGLCYDRPERLTARDIVDNTPVFQDVLKRKGDEMCALRLVPTDAKLPKLRVRGKTLHDNLIWFHEQNIDPDKYKVEIIPHPDETPYAAIFLVNDYGVFGEIVTGWHWQLTQGLHDHRPVTYTFDFTRWQLSEAHSEIFSVAKSALNAIRVTDISLRTKLTVALEAQFTPHGYLKGYFEFAVLQSGEIQFFDYNRVLYHLLHDAKAGAATNEISGITGICASPGIAQGRVKIVLDPTKTDFQDNDILVAEMTMVDYLPLMQKAAAIVTDQGNILSHAAIVCRELKKPCIVGTRNATSLLKNNDLVLVSADQGFVKILAGMD